MLKSRFVAIGCVLAATVSACGGSGSSKPSSSGSSTTTGASGANSGGPNSGGSSGSGPTAPDALVLAKVMTSAQLKGVQDNGGAPGSNTFSTAATVTTAAGKITATLNSYDSVADAASGFSLYLPSTSVSGSNTPPVTIPGVGDKAISVDGTVVVLKGAQVLTASVQMSKAAEDQLDQAKENGATFEAVSQRLKAASDRDLLAVVKAITAKLTGATGSTDLTYLPAGAVDPCAIDPTKLESGDIKVTRAPMSSDTQPMLACVYTFAGSKAREPGTGQLTLYTLTTAQGAAAVPPITPTQEYASTLTGYASAARGGASGTSGVGSDTDGPLSMAAVTNGETDFEALAPLPEGPDDHITIRISSFRSSYVVDAGHCYDEITRMYTEELQAAHASEKITSLIGNDAYDAAKQKIAEDVAAWCKLQEQSGRRAHGSDG